uniref:WD_REPEATS_REGION domain-containing protein n=2 Tax=Macrostomum lignano TaxID=282301 RepID=A0A1I8GDL1_9PLAT
MPTKRGLPDLPNEFWSPASRPACRMLMACESTWPPPVDARVPVPAAVVQRLRRQGRPHPDLQTRRKNSLNANCFGSDLATEAVLVKDGLIQWADFLSRIDSLAATVALLRPRGELCHKPSGNTCDSDLTEAGDELFATSDDLDHEKCAYVGGWLLFRFFKTECNCYGCHQPAKGAAAVATGDPLCATHAAQDADSVMQLRRRVLARYRQATEASKARIERRRCRAEARRAVEEARNLLECSFRATLQALDVDTDGDGEECRLAELLTYETEDAAAMAQDDLVAVHRLARRMELALGQAGVSGTQDPALSAAAAKQLSDNWTSLCRSFAGAVRAFLNTTEVARQQSAVVVESTSWDGLSGDVMWATVCRNTSGYGADADSGVMVSLADVPPPTAQPLPPVCLFASLHRDHQTDHLLALGSDGCRLRVRAELDWTHRVRGLYCDSVRQRLFVSQDELGVTACCLAGRRLFSLSLPAPLCCGGLTGLPADSRLFVFDEANRRVLTAALGEDDSGQPIGCELAAVGHRHTGSFGRLAVVADSSALLLTDFQGRRLLQIRLETGEAAEWPAAPGCAERCSGSPVSVAVDASGRVFVSYTEDHVIDIYSPDGVRLLGRLGELGRPGGGRGRRDGRILLESPCGLAVWPGLEPGLTWLAVAERDARRLRLFLVTAPGSACRIPERPAADPAGLTPGQSVAPHRRPELRRWRLVEATPLAKCRKACSVCSSMETMRLSRLRSWFSTCLAVTADAADIGRIGGGAPPPPWPPAPLGVLGRCRVWRRAKASQTAQQVVRCVQVSELRGRCGLRTSEATTVAVAAATGQARDIVAFNPSIRQLDNVLLLYQLQNRFAEGARTEGLANLGELAVPLPVEINQRRLQDAGEAADSNAPKGVGGALNKRRLSGGVPLHHLLEHLAVDWVLGGLRECQFGVSSTCSELAANHRLLCRENTFSSTGLQALLVNHSYGLSRATMNTKTVKTARASRVYSHTSLSNGLRNWNKSAGTSVRFISTARPRPMNGVVTLNGPTATSAFPAMTSPTMPLHFSTPVADVEIRIPGVPSGAPPLMSATRANRSMARPNHRSLPYTGWPRLSRVLYITNGGYSAVTTDRLRCRIQSSCTVEWRESAALAFGVGWKPRSKLQPAAASLSTPQSPPRSRAAESAIAGPPASAARLFSASLISACPRCHR